MNIENLMHLTTLVIDKQAEGIFLPLDEKNLSLFEIVLGIEKAYDLKRINIPLISPLFWILCKIRPSIMIRLYGSLQFENKNTVRSLGYYVQKNNFKC